MMGSLDLVLYTRPRARVAFIIPKLFFFSFKDLQGLSRTSVPFEMASSSQMV